MADTQSRLERRIARDFPEPGSARGVLQLLAELPRQAGYDAETLASERVQAAIILLADGSLQRLRQAVDLAAADWRDLLVAAGLANEDWPQRLNHELGEPFQPASSRAFHTLGFSPAYSCQVDPELPGNGNWDCPVHGFSRDGSRASEPFRSRWGTPIIVRFTLADTSTWIGMFEAGPGGLDGAFACPGPLTALIACDGQAYLIEVTTPGRTTAIRPAPVTQASGAGPDLIVLASFSELTAIGPHGPAWVSERLCLDRLTIRTASAESIECTGDFIEDVQHFKVDARTGTLQEGPRFLDTWPGQYR
jgi:hypothetical protein